MALVAEVLPVLGVARLWSQCGAGGGGSSRIRATPCAVQQTASDGRVCALKFAPFRLETAEAAHGATADGWVSVRVPMVRDAACARAARGRIEVEADRQLEVVAELERGRGALCCRVCGATLVPAGGVAARVLPLPSAGWEEIAPMLTCDAHFEEEMLTIRPQRGKWLVSEAEVLVHRQDMRPAALLEGAGGAACARCRCQLGGEGGAPDDAVWLWQHRVAAGGAAPIVGRPGPAEYLLSAITSRMRASSRRRFVVTPTSRDGGAAALATTLLVWVVNDLVYAGWARQGEGSAVSLRQGMKVVYVRGCEAPAMAKEWAGDCTVDEVELPAEAVDEVALQLAASTAALPQSQRRAGQGMWAGYVLSGA